MSFNVNNPPSGHQIRHYLGTPLQLNLPIKKITIAEIKNVIENDLDSKSSLGFDLITGKVPEGSGIEHSKELLMLHLDSIISLVTVG